MNDRPAPHTLTAAHRFLNSKTHPRKYEGPHRTITPQASDQTIRDRNPYRRAHRGRRD
jgi:hypothetical protein